jgi:FkbM family methyltransferase
VYKRISFTSLFSDGWKGKEYPRQCGATIDETKLVSIVLGQASVPERTMIDIGAHFGNSAQHFVSKGWKVYCFEPDPVNRKKLVAKFGDASNVVIDPRAVGEKVETGKPLFSSPESSGISSLHAFRDTHKQAALVDVTTVAQIVGQHKLDQIGFLKIDAEGFDFAALRGVPWDRIRPAAIECEFEDAKTVPLGHNWRDMAEFLRRKGYRVYVSEWHPIIRYGIRHDWLGLKSYPCDLASKGAWGNLLAFLEDPGQEAIEAALRECVSVKSSSPAMPMASAPMEQRDRGARNRGVAEEKPKATTNTLMDASTSSSLHRELASFDLFARFRDRVKMRYMIFARAVKGHNLVLFRIGQLTMWSLRVACNHPILLIGALCALIGLALAPVYTPLWEYRAFFWGGAGVLVLLALGTIGVAVVEKAARRLNERQSIFLETRLAEHLAALKQQVTTLAGQMETIKGQVATTSNPNKTVEAKAKAKAKALEQELGALREAVAQAAVKADTEQALDTLKTQSDQASKAVEAKAKALEQELGALREAVAQAAVKAETEQALGTIKTQIEAASNRIAKLAPRVEYDVVYQRFNRVLTPEHQETLQNVWSKRLGVKVTKASLAYMAQRIRTIEQNSLGRLATSIEDAVLRTLVSSAIRAKKREILEIGTLFGIGLSMIYDHNRGRYDSVHVTAIDPLEGYYRDKEPDVLLNIPVTKSTFWRNMRAADVPDDDITLIDEMSTSDEAIERASTKKYDLLVIDGDHSYAGVKADFENYQSMVHRGGFVIFDDYGTSEWPDVQRFVDKEVLRDGRVAHVGSEWRTAVFRVIKSSAIAK